MESALISRSSSQAVDPLSDVLSLLKPRGYMSGGIDAGGDWAVQFDKDQFCRCFALVSGQCWLLMNGVDTAVRLESGDFVVLPHGLPFRLASDPSVTPVDIMSIIHGPLNGNIISWQGGGACFALSALFTFAADHARMLLKVLPDIVHIQGASDRAAMRWYLERMMTVLRDRQPGHVLMAEHLAQMMLIEVLRLHVANNGASSAGWLFGLADAQVSAAITAIHEKPGFAWTLQTLAKRAGMSRSAFALRFKERTGTSAMGYLTRWRMLLAADRLVNSRDSVSAIAASLGYESESSFGFAFKREMGCAPRQYGGARRNWSHQPYRTSAPK